MQKEILYLIHIPTSLFQSYTKNNDFFKTFTKFMLHYIETTFYFLQFSIQLSSQAVQYTCPGKQAFVHYWKRPFNFILYSEDKLCGDALKILQFLLICSMCCIVDIYCVNTYSIGTYREYYFATLQYFDDAADAMVMYDFMNRFKMTIATTPEASQADLTPVFPQELWPS